MESEARAGSPKQAAKSLAQAQKNVAKAREEAARLAGKIETHKEQTAALLARLSPAEDEPKSGH